MQKPTLTKGSPGRCSSIKRLPVYIKIQLTNIRHRWLFAAFIAETDDNLYFAIVGTIMFCFFQYCSSLAPFFSRPKRMNCGISLNLVFDGALDQHESTTYVYRKPYRNYMLVEQYTLYVEVLLFSIEFKYYYNTPTNYRTKMFVRIN